MIKVVAVVGTLALLIAFEVSAYSGDRVVLCDHCGTYNSYQNAALNAVSYGSERLYVVNRPSRVIKRYFVIKESEPGYSVSEATEVDPSQEDLEQINAALDVYVFIKNGGNPSFDEIKPYLPSGYHDLDSALDFAPHSTRRGALRDAVRAWASDGISGVLTTVLVGAVKIIFSFVDGSIIVHFPDGSKYRFDFAELNFSGDGEPLADYNAVEARDAEGNRVPENGDLSGLNIEGSVGVINEWGDLAERLGWELQQLINSCNRVRLTMVCSSGPPRECTIRPEPVCN